MIAKLKLNEIVTEGRHPHLDFFLITWQWHIKKLCHLQQVSSLVEHT